MVSFRQGLTIFPTIDLNTAVLCAICIRLSITNELVVVLSENHHLIKSDELYSNKSQ